MVLRSVRRRALPSQETSCPTAPPRDTTTYLPALTDGPLPAGCLHPLPDLKASSHPGQKKFFFLDNVERNAPNIDLFIRCHSFQPLFPSAGVVHRWGWGRGLKRVGGLRSSQVISAKTLVYFPHLTPS